MVNVWMIYACIWIVLVATNCLQNVLCSDAEAVIGCRIHEQHRSPYVTALLSQPVPSYGCVSRELVPTTQQQVDVLLFSVTSSQTTSGVNRPHTWTTSGHLRQHVYVTLKQSVNYGLLLLSLVFVYSCCRLLTELMYLFYCTLPHKAHSDFYLYFVCFSRHLLLLVGWLDGVLAYDICNCYTVLYSVQYVVKLCVSVCWCECRWQQQKRDLRIVLKVSSNLEYTWGEISRSTSWNMGMFCWFLMQV